MKKTGPRRLTFLCLAALAAGSITANVAGQTERASSAPADPGPCGVLVVGNQKAPSPASKATPPPTPKPPSSVAATSPTATSVAATLGPGTTPTPTPRIAPFQTPTPAPSATASATATDTAPAGINPVETATLGVYSPSTSTPTPSPVPTHTPTSTPVPTNTPTPTPTSTPTATPTSTPTATPTSTPTATPTSTPTATPTDTPTDTPIPTDTPTDTPTPIPTDTPTPVPTDTPTPIPTDTPTPIPTDTSTPIPTDTPTDTPTTGTNPVVGFQSRPNPSGAPRAAALEPQAVLRASPAHAANVVCVWTSDSPAGVPVNYFPPRSSVYLLAAWQMHTVANLARYHLTLRWDIYRGYFGNVSLVPTKQFHWQRRSANVPGTPIVGTFRLTFAPKVDGLRRGWYALVGRVFLYGPRCPKSGCTGQVRQTRFWMY